MGLILVFDPLSLISDYYLPYPFGFVVSIPVSDFGGNRPSTSGRGQVAFCRTKRLFRAAKHNLLFARYLLGQIISECGKYIGDRRFFEWYFMYETDFLKSAAKVFGIFMHEVGQMPTNADKCRQVA